MCKSYHVIIVGSGLAGLAAADLLCGHGLSVLVVDDNAHTGGQLLRRPPFPGRSPKRLETDPIRRQVLRLAKQLGREKVQLLNRAQVLGIYPERTLLVEEEPNRIREYQADALVLSTGARERHLPFRGWDLPGVISLGSAQILMKSSGILPAKEGLIGGCGPLMLALAAEMLSNGGKVQAVLDQSGTSDKLKMVTAGPSLLPKLFEGAVCLARLAAAHVPLRQGVRIVEASGENQLERVVTARVNARGSIIQETEQVYYTPCLAVGYGFSPNIELPQQAGCAISYDADKGGWYVKVDAAMGTSVDGIYAAGETTGIAGAGKSFIEGQIAALDILKKQERIAGQTCTNHMRPLLRKHRQQLRYGRLLNRLSRIQPGCYTDIPDETIVCRCEEVTVGQVRRQLASGFDTLNSIKRATRCCMGRCQGRTCGPILLDLIAAHTMRSPGEIGAPSVRTPVKPVALGALARMTTGEAGNDGR